MCENVTTSSRYTTCVRDKIQSLTVIDSSRQIAAISVRCRYVYTRHQLKRTNANEPSLTPVICGWCQPTLGHSYFIYLIKQICLILFLVFILNHIFSTNNFEPINHSQNKEHWKLIAYKNKLCTVRLLHTVFTFHLLHFPFSSCL